MSTSTAVLIPDHLMNTYDTGIAGTLRALDAIVSSAEPAVVFASVVRLCAPLICDAATVTIRESDKDGYAIAWPPDVAGVNLQIRQRSVVVGISGTKTEEHAGYHASLALYFTRAAESNDQLLGQFIVERAAARVEHERLTELLTRGQSNVDNLELALSSSREIGIAMGILMSTHKIRSDQGFDLLRRVSQRTHRKLHDIALDVATTGAIDLPNGVTLLAQDPSTIPSHIGSRTFTGLLNTDTL
jgi:hypothetical protein